MWYVQICCILNRRILYVFIVKDSGAENVQVFSSKLLSKKINKVNPVHCTVILEDMSPASKCEYLFLFFFFPLHVAGPHVPVSRYHKVARSIPACKYNSPDNILSNLQMYCTVILNWKKKKNYMFIINRGIIIIAIWIKY